MGLSCGLGQSPGVHPEARLSLPAQHVAVCAGLDGNHLSPVSGRRGSDQTESWPAGVAISAGAGFLGECWPLHGLGNMAL